MQVLSVGLPVSFYCRVVWQPSSSPVACFWFEIERAMMHEMFCDWRSHTPVLGDSNLARRKDLFRWLLRHSNGNGVQKPLSPGAWILFLRRS